MFNKLKQFKDLRTQAKKIQQQMDEEVLEISRDGVYLKINGSNEILDLDIETSLLQDKERFIKTIKRVFKEAVSDMQKKMAKKMLGQNINFDALKKFGF